MDSVFRPAALLMSGRAVGFVATFAVPIVLARVFSQSDFGTYKQVFLIYATLMGIAPLGMAESLYYFLPGSSRDARALAANSLIFLGATGLLCMVAVWALRSPIAHWFGNPPLAGDVPIVGVFLAFSLGAVLLEVVMTARKRFKSASVTYAVSDSLRAMFYLVPVAAFGGLIALLWGAVAFAAARFAVTAAYLRREFGRGFRPDTGLLRRQLGYSLPFALAVLVEVVQNNLHLYAVGYYFDAASFAVYSVGCLQIPLVDLMMTSTSNVMMVQMREQIQAQDTGAVLATWRDTTVKMGLIFIPLVGGLVTLARPLIITLFTARYAASVPLFAVGVTAVLLATVMTDSVLRVYAETRYLIFANVVRLAFVAASVSWFLGRYGLIGAVIVTVLAGALFKALGLVRIKFLFRCPLSLLLPWGALLRTLALTAIAAAPAAALQIAFPLPALPALLAGGALYAVACFAVFYFWAPLSRADRSAFLSWAGRPFLGVARALRRPRASIETAGRGAP